jgi:hypothetical protein
MSALLPEGRRLTRVWGEGLREWYVNDQQGLEHGFTVERRPAGGGLGVPLVIELKVRGNLRALPVTDSSGVSFAGAADEAVLRYSGLKVWDAEGRVLRAGMTVPDESHVRLEVEEGGATYPVTVDPVAAPVYLKPLNTDGGDRFGHSVAISGDTAVVGAYLEDSDGMGANPPFNNNLGDSGAVHVFVRSGGVWTQQAYLKASNPGAGDFFGKSVGISGDTIVAGANYEDSDSTGVNSFANNNADQAGAAYVFVRNGQTWSQQAYLKASNTGFNDQFGTAVAVSGDTIVVGAPLEDGGGAGINPPSNEDATASGAAYVFVRSGSTWTQQAYLKASNPGANDNFGSAVAIDGNTVVVGAYLEDGGGTGVNPPPNEGSGDSGAAYVYVRNGTAWSHQAYLKASNTGPLDWFGISVAVSGNTIVCGAAAEDGNGTGVNPPDNPGGADSGAAYVFARSGNTWTQQAYLKGFTNGAIDQFGLSVGVSGDTVIVGAPRENGSGMRLNPVPNNGAADSGAAYVFTRSGTAWFPQTYVKATNTGTDDLFGTSVAISGDTILIGAPDEDGNGTGVNPPDTGTVAASGAAYVYSGIGPAADQDSDSVADLFEIYFGTSPTTAGGVPWTVTVSGGQLRLRWPEVNTTGVTVVPQWSPDLITWLASGETRNGIAARTISVSSVGGNLKEAAVSMSGLTRAWIRLKLTSQ